MPVDLPVRKTFVSPSTLSPDFDNWILMLAIVCFAVALAGLVTHTPKSYRIGLTAAVFESMMQAP